jgi:hypothetical protein
METTTNPSEVIRNKMFYLQWLMSFVEGRNSVKIQRAHADALDYCELSILRLNSKTAKVLDHAEKLLPLWEKIREHLKALDLSSDRRPAWHMEEECDKLQCIYDPVQKEEDVATAVLERLCWTEDHKQIPKEVMNYALEKLVWKHSHLNPFPITYPGLDEAKVALVEKEINDHSGGDYARMPLKKSEAFAITRKLDTAYAKQASALMGGRIPRKSLKDSILISTALRVAASEERMRAVSEETDGWSNGGESFPERVDVISTCLYRDITGSRDALAVLRKAVQEMERHVKWLRDDYNASNKPYSDENLSSLITAYCRDSAHVSIVKIEKIEKDQDEDDEGRSVYKVRAELADSHVEFLCFLLMVESGFGSRTLTVDKIIVARDNAPSEQKSGDCLATTKA